ncbi:MAG: Crp/Fnr family transcriptional regulator [Desulfobacterales bacterium]|nr:MAG: Crp/Fnr family transcriptional regulator [Desulfobacterales bacterium]
MPRINAIISAIPLFSDLSERHLEDIRRIVVEKHFSKGETVFSEGDQGNGFYVVVEGRIKISKVSIEGKEQILHIIGTGEPFGEVPVFEGQRFPANAEAIADSHLLFFPRAAFVNLISQNPSLSLNMLAVLSKRLRRFTVQIENLSLKEVPGRLASYLVYLADEQGENACVDLNISKGQLASILGTIPETLSRIFAKLSAQDLIRVDGRKIYLLDREGLAELATYGRDAG